MATNQVRVLTLNKDENLQHVLYRLEKEWYLRFALGPSLVASTVRVFCNHPLNKTTPYERKTYYELEWKSTSGSKSDTHDLYTGVNIVIAGSFNYFFTIDGSDRIENANGQGYFLVDPTLSVGSEGDHFTLDCLQVQTVLAKSLGPFDEWEGRLYVAKATGYNLVHFTPLQALGTSNSSYSIKDQLALNPVFNREGQNYTFDNVEGLLKKMNREWKVLSMTDLVYNHTADNSKWLQEHPECGFNLDNSPHLKPAYLLDRIFEHFSLDVADGKYVHRGVTPTLDSSSLQRIKDILLHEILPSHKMHEFYTVSVDDILKRFRHGIEENRMVNGKGKKLEIIQDPQYQRNQCRIDMDTVLTLYNTDRPGATSRNQRIKECCEVLQRDVEALNKARTDELKGHLDTAVNNFLANITWRFLDPAGPQIKAVTKKEPLMFCYFIVPQKLTGSLASEEGYMYGETAKYIFACNGWVMGDDPLRNFAEPGSNVYLRRDLVGWGDSAKLNYGKSPDDCPYLWQRMKEYTELTVRLCDSVRLDNCHSTPIHVAEYMLDAARRIRPDLYVVAELFTGGEHLDNLFINRLGINSLIREAMSARNSHKLGELIHRYGGNPVGAFIQPRVQPLVPTMAHALFFDQTHDNKTPIETRSEYDMLPNTALVGMACCASGSNRGYDQLVPHHIHVVTEDRLYTSWADWDQPDRRHINYTFGITRAKKLINDLHLTMGYRTQLVEGAKDKHHFSQVYVDQVDGNCVSVTRHNPVTHESIVLVGRTCHYKPEKPEETGYIRPITLQGVVEEVLFEMQTCETTDFEYVKDEDYINGLPNIYLKIQEKIPPSLSKMVRVEVAPDSMTTTVHFVTFPPGSVIAFKGVLPKRAQSAILEIRRGLGQFGYLMRSYSGRSMVDEDFESSNFRAIVGNLTLDDLNIVLFRCRAEEQADGNGFSTYDIPGYGPMLYCGLRGVSSVLSSIRAHNDLGHPLCTNLRDGDWLPAYIAKRLLLHPQTEKLGRWFQNIFDHLSKTPRFLIPSYFDAIVTGAYVVLREQIFSLMSEFVQDGSIFVQALAMGSVMFCGYVKGSRLPFLSPNLDPPKPPTIQVTSATGEAKQEEACLTLAAGFPHFASEYMRNWGRDTFIALRGLLLLTGRYQEARYIILGYAGTMRHGLIPNLLNEGLGARYNCRDAVWWWLQAIQEYCRLVPDGLKILHDKVSRLYPDDEAEAQSPGVVEQTLQDVIQQGLQHHATGVKYRERNAGTSIDEHMQDAGFNNEIGVKWETGFVFGGNEHNCGTWMDKMGSSTKAGNRGRPATPRIVADTLIYGTPQANRVGPDETAPTGAVSSGSTLFANMSNHVTMRDGSAVELIGLSASTCQWLHKLHADGQYTYAGVNATIDGAEVLVTWKEWYEKICGHFEECFWVNTEPFEGEKNPELIFRRGMYKDTFEATQFWTNTQLRPNFPISMVVAPDMFTPERAWKALETAEEHLLGPLGMKTLDPKDWSYVSYYDNANDSEDPKIAKGFSYHQGPEWVWPIGYFLRAKLLFAQRLEATRPGILKQTVAFIKKTLTKHYEMIMKSGWRSLPELTNGGGKENHFGCPAQAWSVSCVLEVLYDLEHLDVPIPISVKPSKTTQEETVIAPV